MRKILYLLFFLIALSGCGTTNTPYGPRGWKGGYEEKQLNEGTYFIHFGGNGKTSADTVWYYWIYRCAELTKEKGFSSFSIRPKDSPRGSIHGNQIYTLLKNNDPPALIQTKSKGSYFYYSPGGTVTYFYFSSSGIINMYKPPYPENIPFLLDAEKVLDLLAEYVKSEGTSTPPPRDYVIKNSILLNPIAL